MALSHLRTAYGFSGLGIDAPATVRREEDGVAYSVMVWLVNPGEHSQQEDEEACAEAGREHATGAATGVNVGFALPRMVYGVYENQKTPRAPSRRSLTTCSRTLPCALPPRTPTGYSSSPPTGSTTSFATRSSGPWTVKRGDPAPFLATSP
jgi:hypothetical protein